MDNLEKVATQDVGEKEETNTTQYVLHTTECKDTQIA